MNMISGLQFDIHARVAVSLHDLASRSRHLTCDLNTCYLNIVSVAHKKCGRTLTIMNPIFSPTMGGGVQTIGFERMTDWTVYT